MHLFADSTAEFTQACCRLLKHARLYGAYEPPSLEAGEYDPYSERWIKALDGWATVDAVHTALDAEQAHLLAMGRAQHALVLDVATTLLQNHHGDSLLARIQPHFPAVDLARLLPEVRAAHEAYKAADKLYLDWMIEDLSQPQEIIRARAPRTAPAKPPHVLNPTDDSATRAAALLYQLLPLLPESPPATAPTECLCYWQFTPSDPIQHYIDNYFRFGLPKGLDCLPLLRIQREVADRALELKLAVLRATLCGIVGRDFEATSARLAAHFDGDMPGLDLIRFISDPKTGDPTRVLRLAQALENGQWQIACAGEFKALSETDCQALQHALEQLLSVPEQELKQLQDDFKAALTALEKLDDREFQGWLREMQASTLAIMLSGLPPYASDAYSYWHENHPFHDKVARNMSARAWECLQEDWALLGDAPLDAFELTELLGVLLETRPKLLGKRLFVKQRYPVALPDIDIASEIRLTDRSPRQLTLALGGTQWIANIDELRLFLCQLQHRLRLLDSPASFAQGWTEAYLNELRPQDGRWTRFLRPLSREAARLLMGERPQDGRWTDIAEIIMSHPLFGDCQGYA